MRTLLDRYLDRNDKGAFERNDKGAIGYLLLWAMGVPASVLFLIFVLRGCT